MTAYDLPGLDDLYPPENDEAQDAPSTEEVRARQAALRAERLHIEHDARILLAQRLAPPPAAFIDGTLDVLWEMAPDPAPIIDKLLPDGGNCLVNAQRKAGKTVALLNMADSLTVGTPFLGALDVQKLDGRFGILNYELTPGLFTQYSRSLIHQPARVYLNHLMGQPNPFATPEGRERLAQRLRQEEVEVLAADPWASLYTGEKEDNREWRAYLDELMRWAIQDAGCRGFVLANHSGWSGERSRGPSAIEDWANVIAGIRFEDSNDPTSPRYFSAFGRLGTVPEDLLDFNQATGRLTLTGDGGRKQVKAHRQMDDLTQAVVSIVESSPDISGYAVETALKNAGIPHQRGDHAKALRAAVEAGNLVFKNGPRGAKLYRIAPPTPTYPDVPRGATSPPTPTPLYGSGVGGVGQEPVDAAGVGALANLPGDTTPEDHDIEEGPTVPNCPKCGGPNTHTRDTAGLPCIPCYDAAQRSRATYAAALRAQETP